MTHQEMSELQRSLGRIEGNVRQILKNQDNLTKVQGGHGEKINSLKNRQHWYAGGITVAASVIVFFKDAINEIIG